MKPWMKIVLGVFIFLAVGFAFTVYLTNKKCFDCREIEAREWVHSNGNCLCQ